MPLEASLNSHSDAWVLLPVSALIIDVWLVIGLQIFKRPNPNYVLVNDIIMFRSYWKDPDNPTQPEPEPAFDYNYYVFMNLSRSLKPPLAMELNYWNILPARADRDVSERYYTIELTGIRPTFHQKPLKEFKYVSVNDPSGQPETLILSSYTSIDLQLSNLCEDGYRLDRPTPYLNYMDDENIAPPSLMSAMATHRTLYLFRTPEVAILSTLNVHSWMRDSLLDPKPAAGGPADGTGEDHLPGSKGPAGGHNTSGTSGGAQPSLGAGSSVPTAPGASSLDMCFLCALVAVAILAQPDEDSEDDEDTSVDQNQVILSIPKQLRDQPGMWEDLARISTWRNGVGSAEDDRLVHRPGLTPNFDPIA